MRAIRYLLLPALIMASGPARAQDASNLVNNLVPVAASNSVFACKLYNHLREDQSNFFMSPYSISSCLGMATAGARGETEDQMAKVLEFQLNRDVHHLTEGLLHERLNAVRTNKNIELSIANGLWTQKGHDFVPEFLQLATKTYHATVKQADFGTNAEGARKDINDWVAGQTHDRITGLIPTGTLNSMTKLVLVNAAYFKGPWQKSFNKALTTNAPFSLDGGDGTVQVPMMHLIGNFKYSEVRSLQVLELPYSGGEVSMVIFLPAKTRMLPFEGFISEPAIRFWVAPMTNKQVDVFLPKFKATSQFSLADTLTKMGMTNAFGAKADFSGIDGTKDLKISAVVHKAFVEVNEEGTEAAAATAVAVGGHALPADEPPAPPVFRADRPFMFIIRENKTGTILFMGRVADPTK